MHLYSKYRIESWNDPLELSGHLAHLTLSPRALVWWDGQSHHKGLKACSGFYSLVKYSSAENCGCHCHPPTETHFLVFPGHTTRLQLLVFLALGQGSRGVHPSL